MAAKVIGKCEKNFIVRCLRDRQRLDHRTPFVTRPIQIDFREEFGSVVVTLGLTKFVSSKDKVWRIGGNHLGFWRKHRRKSSNRKRRDRTKVN